MHSVMHRPPNVGYCQCTIMTTIMLPPFKIWSAVDLTGHFILIPMG